jgi:hypothetical protein
VAEPDRPRGPGDVANVDAMAHAGTEWRYPALPHRVLGGGGVGVLRPDAAAAGWRCAECSRAYQARIARLAAALVRDHARYDWLGTAEHSAWDECVFCDTLTLATALLLDAPTSRP